MNRAIFAVCARAERKMPFSQWQCSCSQMSWMCSRPVSFFRQSRSIARPAAMPMAAFAASSCRIMPIGARSDMRMGSISSDVDR